MEIVIYARFSYSGQREESIEGQLHACYKYAEENGHTVIAEYIDRGKTATNDNRPQFQQMLEDSKKGLFTAVLVYQLDRFARNRYDSAFNKKKLRDNGVAVISATENISDSPEGKMLEGILEALAEYQSADMAQKIIRGHRVNAEKCVYNGGPVPFGYYIDDDRRFQIDPINAPIVQIVFTDYYNNKTIVDIVEELNACGVKNCRGTYFTVNSFRTMLQNKRYTGCYIYSDIVIPGGIPRIIDDTLFYSVQEKIKRNKKAPSCRERYLLTTKLYCGICNSMMVGTSGTSHTGNVYSYYKCSNKNSTDCDLSNIPKEFLEDTVIAECKKRLDNKSISLIAHECSTLAKKALETPFIAHLQHEIHSCEVAIENLSVALEKGQEIDLVLSRINAKRLELKNLETQLKKETLSKPVLEEEDIKRFLETLRDGDIDSFKYRQSLIAALVNRIYLYNDRLIIIFNSDNSPTEIPLSTIGEIKKALGSHKKSEGVPI